MFNLKIGQQDGLRSIAYYYNPGSMDIAQFVRGMLGLTKWREFCRSVGTALRICSMELPAL